MWDSAAAARASAASLSCLNNRTLALFESYASTFVRNLFFCELTSLSLFVVKLFTWTSLSILWARGLGLLGFDWLMGHACATDRHSHTFAMLVWVYSAMNWVPHVNLRHGIRLRRHVRRIQDDLASTDEYLNCEIRRRPPWLAIFGFEFPFSTQPTNTHTKKEKSN